MKLIKLSDNSFIIIREANKTDAIKMIKYVEKISRESDNLTFGEGEFLLTFQQEEEFIEAISKQKNSLFIIAEDNGKIIGNLSFIGGKRLRTMHSGEFGISVLKEYWGKGVGTELINYLVDWSKESEIIRKINLRVRTDNYAAIHLYEKMGFINEGRISREMIINDKFVDTYQMGLEID